MSFINKKRTKTLMARVTKIIKPSSPHEPEKAQIAVQRADPLYRELRIENQVKDDAGKESRLREGAEIEVKIEANPEATTESQGS
jgi:hypothetical protein